MIRRWFIAGLVVWLPLGATLLIVNFLARLLDSSLLLVPMRYRPETLLGFPVPGLGVVLSLIIVLLTGFLVANFVGRRVLGLGERLLQRIPIVRSVYGGVKRLAETMFSDSDSSFRQVLLVEYPRRGMWSLAFRTGKPVGEVRDKTGENVITVYVPTTPNPTSGFVILVPSEDVIPLDMTVEEGLRMIISMGVVTPEDAAALVPPKAKA